MFPLGHIGLVVGLLISGLIIAKKPDLLGKVDFRLVAVFSMLPDIIDKPLGNFILSEDLNNGRIFAHSLVFLLLFTVLCVILFRKLFWAYAFPVLAHQVLDFMWEVPNSWYWPLQGWGFESMDMDVWAHWVEELFTDPYVLIGELVGLGILVTVFVFFRFYRKDNFIHGLKKGRLFR
jgi:hypothetical protein